MDAEREGLLTGFRRVQLVFPGQVPTGFTTPGMRMSVQGAVVSAVGSVAEEQLSGYRALPGVRVDVFPMSLEDIVVEVVGNAPHQDPSPAKPEP